MDMIFIVIVALFGCAVSDPSPRFKNEVNNKIVNNKENIESPIVVKKDRDKRNANLPDLKPPVKQEADESIEELSRNTDFLKNLKLVFGLDKQSIVPASFAFDETTINLTNENNTGMDDRLRPHRTVLVKFRGFVDTTTQKPTTTANDIQSDSKDDQDNQIRLVFGNPPSQVENETPSEMATPISNMTKNSVTSSQTVNETNADNDKNGTDYRFTSSYVIKESYNRLGNGGSWTHTVLHYKCFIALILVFTL